MKLIRRWFLLAFALLLVTAAWFWWNLPRRVDMAAYAPAESIVYLEANNLLAVAGGITHTEAWKAIGPILNVYPSRWFDPWLAIAAKAGFGPVQNVIIARAQIAVVVVDLNSAEEGATLQIKPEGATIIETHTSARRMQPAVELLLQQFAEKTYGAVTLKRYREGAEYFEWSPPAGDRRIVAAIDDSVVVIGNTKHAVQACLETRHGQRPSLAADSGLQRMRARLRAREALAFGYVSSPSATRLFLWAAPLLLGRAPGDLQLEKVMANSASKILRALGWSSNSASGGIEDRFLFSFEPSLVSQLRPVFNTANVTDGFWKLVPAGVYSLTLYNSANPATAWSALQSVASLQLDALSALWFNSMLKASALPYGVKEPKEFLVAVGPQLITVRQGPEDSLLIARARDKPTLKALFMKQSRARSYDEVAGEAVSFEIAERKFLAYFADEYLLLGAFDDVRALMHEQRDGATMNDDERSRVVQHFLPASSASVVTYTNDNERIRDFISTLMVLRNASSPGTMQAASLERIIGSLPYSATETTLGDDGLERRTISAFGQFSSLGALLKQDEVRH